MNLLDRVGNTPLLRLSRASPDLGAVELYGKAEWRNPGGSVKDRAALAMVRRGIADGLLSPGDPQGRVLIDATSGNTGIAYALIGTVLGFPVEICLPKNASPERKAILASYGAHLTETSPLEGSDGAIREARRRYAEDPERYFYPDQYSNEENWRAHYRTTAEEIWRQTEGRVTHFIAGLGTSGTLMGAGRRLRELSPAVRLLSFEPDGPMHGLEGLKHMETALVPAIYDPDLADERLTVSTEDAYEGVHRLARREGILVGISAGAAFRVAERVARGLTEGVVVTILCDGGEKYLSERFWEEGPPPEWDPEGEGW